MGEYRLISSSPYSLEPAIAYLPSSIIVDGLEYALKGGRDVHFVAEGWVGHFYYEWHSVDFPFSYAIVGSFLKVYNVGGINGGYGYDMLYPYDVEFRTYQWFDDSPPPLNTCCLLACFGITE